ncbi:hypothetical protein [Phytohabitans houttuyneae]|uniref:Uncharacterized protein n=1 Tax=Phytohabitans houttuyneae TaxID=1076126 RepID=A0A6V8K303_9ACTN|nr:hypothetical protein [Phytohabitans houttuyneae]GFJ76346.1 hypothetical protein Phou_005260 [Phytohabitans houttuyneae]
MTQTNESFIPAGDEPDLPLVRRRTGEKCPESGKWQPVGLGGRGRQYFEKGETFPRFEGASVEWIGPIQESAAP